MVVGYGGWPGGNLVLVTMVAGALTAGGASAINQYIDRNRDSAMQRTRNRPLPGGRLAPRQALVFGLVLSLTGLVLYALGVNGLSAVLALIGLLYYVVLYSLILKDSTWQNIIVGGGAGAIPPMVGWAAATGGLSVGALFLFAIVFFWTPPHFWALAMLRSRDYARAGVPMLPVVHGEGETRRQILMYTVQLVALTMLLPLAGLGNGGLYLAAAATLGAGLGAYAWRLWRRGGNLNAYRMYRYSSVYLALIFAALVVDTLLLPLA
jgi:protoheme IX farnesyltransferase